MEERDGRVRAVASFFFLFPSFFSPRVLHYVMAIVWYWMVNVREFGFLPVSCEIASSK